MGCRLEQAGQGVGIEIGIPSDIDEVIGNSGDRSYTWKIATR
jgi:hypothetical protein